MTDTPNLGLPFIEAAQAQKHVTHNEALRLLDVLTQLAVQGASAVPPASPANGERHIVSASPVGAFSGQAGKIAVWQDNAWVFLTPRAGWQAFIVSDQTSMLFDGTGWHPASTFVPAAGRNRLINGDFGIWQRGTSFTTSGYTSDRWQLTVGTGASATVSRQSLAVGTLPVHDEPSFVLRLSRTAAGTAATLLEQKVERVASLAGSDVTLSFYAKASAPMTLETLWIQNFGTGGSPSVAVFGTVLPVSLTPAWTRHSVTFTLPAIAGKTVGSNADDHLTVRLALPVAAGAMTVDLACVQLEAGMRASPWVTRARAQEETDCQRYYQTLPALSLAGGTRASGEAILAASIAPMRQSPAVTLLSNAWSLFHDGAAPLSGTVSLLSQSTTAHAVALHLAGAGTTIAGRALNSLSTTPFIALDAEL